MKIYKKWITYVSIICAVCLLFSTKSVPVVAVTTNTITATTNETVKQGSTAYCYVYIDSLESLAALDVTVHFDNSLVKIKNVYNSVDCTLYDSVVNTDNIQFSYILNGEGTASKTRLFYFQYQVLGNADIGDAYFDITIGEAYDNSLNDVNVSGSRCKFNIAETVTSKSCSVYGDSSMSTAVEQEFTLNYRFSTYQIASGTAIINYDPELFEVVKVTNGAFLTDKVVDINTELTGEIYISFVGTKYYSNTNLVSVTFRTIKNVTDTSKIIFKATELCDKELNSISCSGYTTNVNVAFDETYLGDLPAVKLDGTFLYEDKQIVLDVYLGENSNLGAGDFVINFNPELVSYNSCTKGFEPSFFNINDKKVEEGELKFHIISLSDIVTKEKVLTVVFDVKQPYNGRSLDFKIDGTGLTNSLTDSIFLNFVDESVLLKYKVTFCDDNGKILQSDLYNYGDIVQEPVTPTKEINKNIMYTFAGWDKAITPCTMDKTYTATYKKITCEWKHNENGWWYQGSDGSYPKNEWKCINGKWYHFNQYGYMQTGWYIEDGIFYYFDESGAMQTNKWIENKYYVKEDGSMAISEIVDNGKYYVDKNGVFVTNTRWLNLNNNWYYLINGTVQKSKWTKVGEKFYYFDGKGIMQTSKWIENKYYVKSDGSMAISEIVDNGKYYVDKNGVFVTSTRWLNLNNNWYYLINGTVQKSKWTKVGEKFYYFDGEGIMQTNKWIENKYYVKSDGSMAISEIVDNGKYYVDKNGVFVTSTRWLNLNDNWYYLVNGTVQKSKWTKVGEKFYYFDVEGIMQTNKWIENKYYVKADGSMAVSEFVENGKYYVDENGAWVSGTKWLKVNDNWYYIYKGTVQKSKWSKVGTKWYYFDESGVMQTSRWINGIYYVKADGSMAVSEWVNNGKYYVGSDGKWVKGA